MTDGMRLFLPASEVEVFKRMSLACLELKGMLIKRNPRNGEDLDNNTGHPAYCYIHIRGRYAQATNGHMLIRHKMPSMDIEGSWLLAPVHLEDPANRLSDGSLSLPVDREGKSDDGGLWAYPDTQAAIDECQGLEGYEHCFLGSDVRAFVAEALYYRSLYFPVGEVPWFAMKLEKGRISVDGWELRHGGRRDCPVAGLSLEKPVGLAAHYLLKAFEASGNSSGIVLWIRPEEDEAYFPVKVDDDFEWFLIMPMKGPMLDDLASASSAPRC